MLAYYVLIPRPERPNPVSPSRRRTGMHVNTSNNDNNNDSNSNSSNSNSSNSNSSNISINHK